jgi:hypothetical protein
VDRKKEPANEGLTSLQVEIIESVLPDQGEERWIRRLRTSTCSHRSHGDPTDESYEQHDAQITGELDGERHPVPVPRDAKRMGHVNDSFRARPSRRIYAHASLRVGNHVKEVDVRLHITQHLGG